MAHSDRAGITPLNVVLEWNAFPGRFNAVVLALNGFIHLALSLIFYDKLRSAFNSVSFRWFYHLSSSLVFYHNTIIMTWKNVRQRLSARLAKKQGDGKFKSRLQSASTLGSSPSDDYLGSEEEQSEELALLDNIQQVEPGDESLLKIFNMATVQTRSH